MRKCHLCGHEDAANHFQNGDLVRSVCHECVSIRGFDMENDGDVYAVFKMLYRERTSDSVSLSESVEKCPSCGTSIANFVNTMKVGCVDCYDAFSFVVEMIAIDDSDNDHGSHEILAMQLSQAISEERYEDAADIRDLMEKADDKADR